MRTLILHRLRHLYHAKPDGLQVPCQMPYYIYKRHLEHQAIYGHDLDQPTGSNDTGVCRSVCCLHCADITYSEWALCILQSKVQSVFSVELPDSSQSLMAKRRGGNLMQLDAIQISACVRRAGRTRRSTAMSVRVGIKRIEQTRKYLLAHVVVSLTNKSSKLKASEKRDDQRADLSNSTSL